MSNPAPLREMAGEMRNGRRDARALTEAAINAHDRLDALAGAYMCWRPEAALVAAGAAADAFSLGRDLGDLQGIPVSLKDNFGLSGTQTFAGSAAALPPPLDDEGPLVAALRAQHTPITGKTHTDEFAYGGIGMVSHWGIPRNPWDREVHRVAGGSSSGAGVSLLEGSAHVALATDTSGSVRRPAAMTGTVGLKLTFGRWPVEGMVPLTMTLDTPGLLARTVEDTAFAFCALDAQCAFDDLAAGAAEGVSGMRIGICRNVLWEACSPGIAEAVQTALRELEAAGAVLIDLDLPEVDEATAVVANGGVVASEFYAFISNELPEWLERLHPLLGGRLSGSDRPDQSAVDYLANVRRLERAAASFAQRMNTVDVLVSPTVPLTPPRVDDVRELAPYEAANRLAVRNTYVPSLLKICALSMPAGLDSAAMPVGMQLMAPSSSEEKLLALAMRIERCIGSAQDRLGTAPLLRSSP